MILLSHAILAK